MPAMIAGTALPITAPARAPIAKAANVHAASATPVRSKNCGASRATSPEEKNG